MGNKRTAEPRAEDEGTGGEDKDFILESMRQL